MVNQLPPANRQPPTANRYSTMRIGFPRSPALLGNALLEAPVSFASPSAGATYAAGAAG